METKKSMEMSERGEGQNQGKWREPLGRQKWRELVFGAKFDTKQRRTQK